MRGDLKARLVSASKRIEGAAYFTLEVRGAFISCVTRYEVKGVSHLLWGVSACMTSLVLNKGNYIVTNGGWQLGGVSVT